MFCYELRKEKKTILDLRDIKKEMIDDQINKKMYYIDKKDLKNHQSIKGSLIKIIFLARLFFQG